jgi:D-galactarolactone cycloisomerase
MCLKSKLNRTRCFSMVSAFSNPSQITRIDGYEIRCELPEPVGNSRQFFDSRSSLLIAVTTASGVTGWGETWAFPSAAAALIREKFAPGLVGLDAATPRPIWSRMESQLGYDRRGISFMAIGAIDVAIWDAAARLQDRPLHSLLGGALRDRLPAYVSGPFMKPGSDPYKDFIADIDGYLDAGFRAIKLRMGTTPQRDGEVALMVRQRIGADFPLMVDLNEGFDTRAALDVAHRLSEADLIWLEEPIAHDNLPGYRKLSEHLPMGLAGGEALFGLNAFRDYIGNGVFDFVQPDLGLCGGVSEGLRIAALADAFDVPVIPHVWGSAVNFHASLHFASVLPARRGRVSYPLFEYDNSYNPLRTQFTSNPIAADGTVAVPEGPGLGLDLSPEKLEPFIVNAWSVG